MAELMRFDDDCGLVVVSHVTQNKYDDVKEIWPGQFFGSLNDSYIHHQRAVQALGHTWTRKTIHDVIAGRCKPERTAILLNEYDDPETFIREDLFKMHWVVLAETNEAVTRVHWGDGTVKTFKHDAIRKHFINPFCVAYEVTLGYTGGEIPWYKKLYTWITGWLGSWFD